MVQKKLSLLPLGEKNEAFGQYFIGQSYLATLSGGPIPTFNVTFEPRCRNNWHIHNAVSGGGQMLICVAGQGWYQEWGRPARRLNPGDVVNIPAGVKHWHGAAADSWFQHIAIEVPGEGTGTEWCESVDDAIYNSL
jgi:4-carboxymuconolactone decarboxylase